MEKVLLAIDADPAVYRAGFAAQDSVHEYVYTDGEGKMHQRTWDDGRKAQAFFRENEELEVLSHEKLVTPQPEEFARQAAKTIMTRTIAAVEKKMGVPRNSMEVDVLLSGPGNFREGVATIIGYKSGRTAPPPIHYQVIRNYFTEMWGARVIHGREADDECSILAYRAFADGRPYVVATIDKDLDQIPGVHYDYRQHVFYDVAEYDANLFFWEQVLSGDATDSIPGCYRIGSGRAKKYVAQWVEDMPFDADLDEYLWQNTLEVYAGVLKKYPDRYPEGMTPEEAATETARLVKMQEYEGQLWTPPGAPDKTLDDMTGVKNEFEEHGNTGDSSYTAICRGTAE